MNEAALREMFENCLKGALLTRRTDQLFLALHRYARDEKAFCQHAVAEAKAREN